MLLVAIVKVVVSLISFPALISFVYRRADLFELILYSATLLKVFISGRRSLIKFLGLHTQTFISSAKSESLTSFSDLYPHDLLLVCYCSS